MTLGLAWTANVFGGLGNATGPPVGVAGVTATVAASRQVIVTASVTGRLSDPIAVQLQWSAAPPGVRDAWVARQYESEVREVTLKSGEITNQRWAEELDVPAAQLAVTLWARVRSGGRWVGIASGRAPGVVEMSEPPMVLRVRPPGAVSVEDVVAELTSSPTPAVELAARVRNTSSEPLGIAVRWGLTDAGSGVDSRWATTGMAPGGSVTWLDVQPGASATFTTRGGVLEPSGGYLVRIQAVVRGDPVTAGDAAESDILANLPVSDDVLLTRPIRVTAPALTAITRLGPPAGPLAVVGLSSPAVLAAGRPTDVIVRVSNLSDVTESGTVFVILGHAGDTTPWLHGAARSISVPVVVPPERTDEVAVPVVPAPTTSTAQLSGWIHGAQSSTAADHVDGAFLDAPVSIASP